MVRDYFYRLIIVLIVAIISGFSTSNGIKADEYSDIIRMKYDQPVIQSAKRQITRLYDYELWCISLSGFLCQMNHQDLGRLSPEVTSFRNKQIRTILKRDWNIVTKDDLLERISWCKNTGHSAAYYSNKRKRSVVVTKESKLTTSQEKILDEYSEVIGSRDLKAWDLGRAIWIIRNAYAIDLITDKEAWQLICPIADEIGARYNSWEDYGMNYLLGRLWWAGFERFDETMEFYNKLTSKKGAWSRTPWFPNASEKFIDKWTD